LGLCPGITYFCDTKEECSQFLRKINSADSYEKTKQKIQITVHSSS